VTIREPIPESTQGETALGHGRDVGSVAKGLVDRTTIPITVVR
jgi:hypothetical protein